MHSSTYEKYAQAADERGATIHGAFERPVHGSQYHAATLLIRVDSGPNFGVVDAQLGWNGAEILGGRYFYEISDAAQVFAKDAAKHMAISHPNMSY